MSDVRFTNQYMAPPPPCALEAAPPPYEPVYHSKANLFMAVGATLMSALGFATYWFKGKPEENIVYVDKPTIVEKPFYVNETVYVDKPYMVEKIVYIDKPFVIEKTIYVDRVVEQAAPLVATTTAQNVYVDPYDGL